MICLRSSLCLSRRAFALAVCLSCGVVTEAGTESTEGHRTAPPNFVVVLCDDLGYGDLACFGHARVRTDNLDLLAANGVRLTSFYAAAPVCSPSRVGLLTGQSPNRLGVYDWISEADSPASAHANRGLVHLRAGIPTIATVLRDAGYATCLAGKWHCNSAFNQRSQPQPDDAGFDHWFATQNNAFPSHEDPTNFVRNGAAVGRLDGFSCQLVAGESIHWLRSHAAESPEQPFLLFVAFHEPHEPIASPRQLVEGYRDEQTGENEAQYLANVHNVDLAVGRLIEAIDELRLSDQTLVLFTSDNGPETLRRYAEADRCYGSAGGLRGRKLWTTEGGIRVPAIARWPGRLPAGVSTDAVVSGLDVLPTLCALSGAPTPEGPLDGVDASMLLDGRRTTRQAPLVWCYYNALNEKRFAMRVGPWKLLARIVDRSGRPLARISNVYPGNSARLRSSRLADHAVYDLTVDPREERSVRSGESDEVAELVGLADAQYQRLVDASPVWSPDPNSTGSDP